MNKLRIIHQNVNGLLGKKRLFRAFLEKYHPDICCLNEVKTKRSFKFHGYNMKRKDRTHKDGGGIIVLVKKGIEFEEVDLGNHGNSVEHIAINVILEDKSKILISSVYCPPEKHLVKSLFKRTVRENKNSIILGDLNAHLITNGSSKDDKRGRQLKEILFENRLIHKNERMKTYRNNTSGNEDCLDVVLATHCIHNRIGKIMVVDNVGSDHYPMCFDIQVKPMRKNIVIQPKYQFHKADWENFRRDITTILRNTKELSVPKSVEDIENFTNKLTDIIIKAADDNIPKTKEAKNTASTPYPSDVIMMIKQKGRLRKEFQQSRDQTVKTQLNNLQKRLKRRIESVNKEMFNRETEKLANATPNSSQFWKEFRKIEKSTLGNDNDIPPLIRDDKNKNELPAYTDKEKSHKFADHLENTFRVQEDAKFDDNHRKEVEKDVEKLKEDFNKLEPNFNGAIVKQVNAKELKQVIKDSKNKKAGGEDKIQSEMLKNLPYLCLDRIKTLLNAVLKAGYYPKIWKKGIITMIHKPKKPDNLTKSYRPICLTSHLGKLLERILTKRLTTYAESFSHIHPKHAGYRKNRSTTDHLVRLVSAIEEGFYKDRDNPKMTAALFIDIEKAFDNIWHEGLLFKLKRIGLTLQDLKIVSSYLENRTFSVRINDCYSSTRNICAGVPQGGLLSPILFLIYTSDIPDRQLKRNNIDESRFADDMDAWASHSNSYMLTFLMQVAAYVYETWSNKWRLKLNPEKCSIVVFKSCKENDNIIPTLNVKINGKSVANKPVEKFLGLSLDSKLTWNEHMKTVEQSFNHRIRILRELRWNNIIDKAQTIKLYQSLILSKIEYGMPAWLNHGQTHRKKLQVWQNDCLRLANKVTRMMRRRINDLHDDARIPLMKDQLANTARNYFKRKESDPLLLEVRNRLENRNLTKIGWHRIMHRL